MTDGWVSVLAASGVVGTVGGVLTAAVQLFGKRSESKAAAADLVTSAAGRMVERLELENQQLREAVLLLTDVLDEVMPLLDAPPDALLRLRQARRAIMKVV